MVGEPGERVRSTYGWLLPVRATATNGVNYTFVYPRSPGDPTAEKVLDGFRVTPDGFASNLGSVHGTLYVGRTSAGGEGESIDLNGDGKAGARFDTRCRFVLQLRNGRILSAEADRKTALRIGGRVFQTRRLRSHDHLRGMTNRQAGLMLVVVHRRVELPLGDRPEGADSYRPNPRSANSSGSNLRCLVCREVKVVRL